MRRVRLTFNQMESAHKIYTNIGTKPFKTIDYAMIDFKYIHGLRLKGALRKQQKRGKDRRTIWILTDFGVEEALRYQQIMETT